MATTTVIVNIVMSGAERLVVGTVVIAVYCMQHMAIMSTVLFALYLADLPNALTLRQTIDNDAGVDGQFCFLNDVLINGRFQVHIRAFNR